MHSEQGYKLKQEWNPGRWMSIAALLGLAGVLRFYRLDTQLWLDEIAGLHNYRKPLATILTTFPGFMPNPLYEVLAHGSLVLFGESPFAIRLPAALFGVLGVWMFYRLARRLVGQGEALLAAALLAVSFHHIFFSQNARGYTLFLFFALLSTDLLLPLLDVMHLRRAVAYAGMSALTTYSHPFGLFVPMGQLLTAFAVVWFRRRRGHRTSPMPAHLLGIVILTGLMVLLLYAPFIGDIIAFSMTSARASGHGDRVFGLLPELLAGLRAAFRGWFGVMAAALVGAIGILGLSRRHPVAVALLMTPLLLAALAVGLLGAGVHPRYFLLALPLGYLAGTHGVVIFAQIFVERVMRPSPAKATPLLVTLAAVLVVTAAVPLKGYYAVPKQDYLGALRLVRALAAEGDRVVAADLAGHAIQAYYAVDFPVVEDVADLLQQEVLGSRVWVVTTLERVVAKRKPDLMAHLRQHYRLVRVLPGSLGDGAMRIYLREGGKLEAGTKVSGEWSSPSRPDAGKIARDPG